MLGVTCNKCKGKQNISIYSFSPQKHSKKSVGASSKTSVTNLVNYPTMVSLKNAPAFVFHLKQENMSSGFYPSTSAYNHFPPKDSVSLLIALFRGSVGGPMVETEVNIFETYACRLLENAFFLNFSRNFMGSFMGSFEEMLTRKMHTTFFYACL